MATKKVLFDDVDVFVFDFDGVLTNNIVYVNEHGLEWVACNRADGLAFDVLHKLGKKTFILSTEINPVVTARAKKLKIETFQGIRNKAEKLTELATERNISLSRTLYVGNDLNDYHAMLLCGYSMCPADSHDKIKQIATATLKSNGGDGVARELIEDILGIDVLNTLYN